MVFLDGPRRAAGRRYNQFRAATGAAFLFMGVMALAGCGGGGDDSPDPNATPTPNSNAIVRGRIIEDTTRQNVSGAVVRIGNTSMTTGPDGRFELQLPGGGGAKALIVEFPAGGFQPNGSYRGSSCVDLAGGGIALRAEDLESGDIVEVEDISVFNTTTSPPPPPCNF